MTGVVVSTSCSSATKPVDDSSLVEALRQLDAGPVLEARLSLPSALPSCPMSHVTGRETPPECAVPVLSPSDPAVSRIAALASSRSRSAGSVDALHAAGLIDLLWSRDAATTGRAVQLLEAARLVQPSSRDVLVDLSAAYLTRATQVASTADLLLAVERSAEAIALDSTDRRAMFNHGLALRRLGVAGAAARAFRTASATVLRDDRDGSEAWITTAARLAAAEAAIAMPRKSLPFALDRDGAALDSVVSRDRVRARYFGWDSALVRWGSADLSGDGVAADTNLRIAAQVARALARVGGDTSLASAVGAVRERSGTARTRLAEAHLEFGRCRAAYERAQSTEAMRACDSAMALSADAPALQMSARLWRGIAEAQWGDARRAAAVLEPLLEPGSASAFPALVARARSALAATQIQRGATASALVLLSAAESDFARVHEREHVGLAQSLRSVARRNLGDRAGAIASANDAIGSLALNRTSIRLHNALYQLADLALADGLTRTSLVLAQEDLAVTQLRADGFAMGNTEALIGRIHARRQQLQAALAAFDRARTALRETADGISKRWVLAMVQSEEMQARAMWNLPVSRMVLDSCLGFFDGMKLPLQAAPVRQLRAALTLADGRVDDARRDFETIVAIAERELAAADEAEQRRSLLGTRRSASEQLMRIALQRGDTLQALLQLERGRSAGASLLTPVSARSLVAEARSPVVDYALIGDSLYTFVLWRGRVTVRTQALQADSLRMMSDRLQRLIALGSDAAVLRADLQTLHDRIVRPIRAELGDTGSVITVIADGELTDLPLAAMINPVTGRYVVEDWAVQYASSLKDALTAPRSRRAPPTHAVLVADPAHDLSLYPGLARLAGARDEIGAVAPLYREPLTLLDSAVTYSALERAAGQADVLHFAGHTLFDEERPEQSELVIAGRRQVTAGAIRLMTLDRLRLVVLASCEGGRSGAGRATAIGGLVAAFRDAGVETVVAGTWQIPDRESREFFQVFHASYVTSGYAARALRDAQKRAIASVSGNRKTFVVWSGFRAIGVN